MPLALGPNRRPLPARQAAASAAVHAATWAALGLLPLASFAAWAADASCTARSGAAVPTVVELYTSEGCNSCPPADRWLSGVKDQPGVVALAFHVDYWDRLGWADRFASPAYTQRQAQQQRTSGSSFSYTPQVLVDGRDARNWPAAPRATARTSPVTITLTRQGRELLASVTPSAAPTSTPGTAPPSRLAAYWVVTEDQHHSAVKSGENSGVTLLHDRVVRHYQPVPAWTGSAAQTLRTELPASADARGSAHDTAHPGRAGLVVIDPSDGRPVQALLLGC